MEIRWIKGFLHFKYIWELGIFFQLSSFISIFFFIWWFYMNFFFLEQSNSLVLILTKKTQIKVVKLHKRGEHIIKWLMNTINNSTVIISNNNPRSNRFWVNDKCKLLLTAIRRSAKSALSKHDAIKLQRSNKQSVIDWSTTMWLSQSLLT